MVANGFTVFFLDEYRSTPELSFLVRHKQCDCGIMVTASHNPPSDNAVKVYWSTGGQVVPPHDKAIVERVMSVGEIKRADFQQAVTDGKIILCKDKIDAAFIENVVSQSTPGPRDLKIIYSPLHGVGESAAVPALWADGFRDVEIYAPHRNPDGTEVACPHLHVYREGHGDKWASPAPAHLCEPSADAFATCVAFMAYCNIVEAPSFVVGLF
jgi:phosphoglucomutase/phosphomannomutase